MKSTNVRFIQTDLFGKKNFEIISSVLGQLSDGIWENSPCMEKYWMNFEVIILPDDKQEQVVLKVNNNKYWEKITYRWDRFSKNNEKYILIKENPFVYLTDKQIKDWIAGKVKKIVKEEEKDCLEKLWNKKDTEHKLEYYGYLKNIYPADVYQVYDILKERKIKES